MWQSLYTLTCLRAILLEIQPCEKGENREWGKKNPGPSLHTQTLAIRKPCSMFKNAGRGHLPPVSRV